MKFLHARRRLRAGPLRILDIGCGNHSPTITKRWFPGCRYEGADIQQYNLSREDLAAMDAFHLLGVDGSGYSAMPDGVYDFVILHHVVEHMTDPLPIPRRALLEAEAGRPDLDRFSIAAQLVAAFRRRDAEICDDSTHVRVPNVWEISNVLLANGVKVLHAGTSRSFLWTAVGAAELPGAMVRKLLTGKFPARLWYILGFKDHVFGQRKLD